VTNKQYHECVKAGICDEPLDLGINCTYLYATARSAPDYPINCVSLRHAQQFAHYAGASLPTDIEWLHAASSGGQHFTLPNGLSYASQQNFVLCDQRPCKTYSAKVCVHAKGNSVQGVCDLIGNVAEYVKPTLLAEGEGSVMGGGFQDPLKSASVYYRSRVQGDDQTLDKGIRLVVPGYYGVGYTSVK
jgi:formylglycine-generating enzyme required for sulfatase activity